jgi:hypothetical protein
MPLRRLSLLLLLAPACAADDDEASRRAFLTTLADHVIVPIQADLAASSATLASDLGAVCEAPGQAALDAARHSWALVRDRWDCAGAWFFGPVATGMHGGPLDFWPVRVDSVESAIAAATAVDAAAIDALGTSAKGIPALEYLLFGDPRDDAATLAALADAHRCAYAGALADDIAERTAAISKAWSDEHATALKTAGEGSDVYPSTQAALDAVVNASIENLYGIVKTKLDRPLGNLTDGAVDPEQLESRFSGRTRDDLLAALGGFQLVYHGPDRAPGDIAGLDALVAARDPELDGRITAQLTRSLAAVEAIPTPAVDTLASDRAAFQTARDEVDALRRYIKLDVASLLGVTLSISDNDGD